MTLEGDGATNARMSPEYHSKCRLEIGKRQYAFIEEISIRIQQNVEPIALTAGGHLGCISVRGDSAG